MTQALYFIVKTLAQLFILLLLLRFWLPILRADFRNPVAQGILRFTSPLVVPVRRILPSIGRLDTATVLIAFVVQFLAVVVLLALFGADHAGLRAHLAQLRAERRVARHEADAQRAQLRTVATGADAGGHAVLLQAFVRAVLARRDAGLTGQDTVAYGFVDEVESRAFHGTSLVGP